MHQITFGLCFSCEYGQYTNKVIFRNINARKRTDETFRLQLVEEHQLGESPLISLPIDFIKHFPIDYMHCICLGLVKKFIGTWISGPLNCGRDLYKISENINK